MFGFEAWRKDKGGNTDLEIEKAVDKLLKEARCDFYGRYGEGHPISKWQHDGKDWYHIPRQYIVPDICKTYQYKKLVEALKGRNMLVLTKDGEVREQTWFGTNSNRPRGISLIKERLYGDDVDKRANSIRESVQDTTIAQYTQIDYDDLNF